MSEQMRKPARPTPQPQVAGGQGQPNATAQVEGGQGGEEFVVEGGGMPVWLDVAFPWMVSFMLHLGVGLVFVFTMYAFGGAAADNVPDPIVIPSSFEDPSLTTGTPGGVPHPGTGDDPNRDAAQDKLKEVMKADGWAQNQSDANAASFLDGATADNDALMITSGSGGSIGKGAGGAGRGEGGPIAPYGTPGGGTQAGPKSSFYGTGGNAVRIVYILDHSGSMLDNFDYLRKEVKKSTEAMAPIQKFNIVMVSESAAVIGPKGAALPWATVEFKREVVNKLYTEFRAQGRNDDLLPPFKEAFEEAFKMKPQLIFFLTDGHFDPKLMEVVNGLNKDKKVIINTLAFVNRGAEYEEQLQKLSKENGGKYKFVAENDLGQ